MSLLLAVANVFSILLKHFFCPSLQKPQERLLSTCGTLCYDLYWLLVPLAFGDFMLVGRMMGRRRMSRGKPEGFSVNVWQVGRLLYQWAHRVFSNSGALCKCFDAFAIWEKVMHWYFLVSDISHSFFFTTKKGLPTVMSFTLCSTRWKYDCTCKLMCCSYCCCCLHSCLKLQVCMLHVCFFLCWWFAVCCLLPAACCLCCCCLCCCCLCCCCLCCCCFAICAWIIKISVCFHYAFPVILFLCFFLHVLVLSFVMSFCVSLCCLILLSFCAVLVLSFCAVVLCCALLCGLLLRSHCHLTLVCFFLCTRL